MDQKEPVALSGLEGKSMILLIAKTWFLWWMLAIVVIVRWFHVLSAGATVEARETLSCSREEVQIVSGHP
jgi:hypothetical protein